MICRPCRVFGIQSEAAYERQMMGEGLTYRAHQCLQVQCPEFGAYLAKLLASHQLTQHGVGVGDKWETPLRDNHICIGFPS